MQRRSGILLHPSSLPGPYPIGDFGSSAYRFIDWLTAAGQTLWQVLPLGSPDTNGSPYASHSAFGISSLLLDLTQMRQLELLCDHDISHTGVYPQTDYHQAWRLKQNLVAHSHGHFIVKQNAALEEEFRSFREANAWWLDDHALFDALKKDNGGAPWFAWPEPYRHREREALAAARQDLRQEILNEQYAQWLAHRQWLKLKSYANEKGISIIGDLPFFVRHDSVDVWVYRDQFLLNADDMPTLVAGAPPDLFSETGQLWGNPIYNWEAMAATGYEWWRRRAQYAGALFDALRLDHFRGFQALWQVAGTARNAMHGQWVATPGEQLLDKITKEIPAEKLIAEDIGFITKEVIALRDRYNLAGTRVMQFGFYNDKPDGGSLPHMFPEHCVAYTGTHDTPPLKGWIESAPEDQRLRALAYTQANPNDFSRSLVERGLRSKARWFLSQMQDILNLGNEARMNIPNQSEGNWAWRLADGALTDERAALLRDLTAAANRG